MVATPLPAGCVEALAEEQALPLCHCLLHPTLSAGDVLPAGCVVALAAE